MPPNANPAVWILICVTGYYSIQLKKLRAYTIRKQTLFGVRSKAYISHINLSTEQQLESKQCYWLLLLSSSSSSLFSVLIVRLALADGAGLATPCDTGTQHWGFSIHVLLPKSTLRSPSLSTATTFPVLPITWPTDEETRLTPLK